MVKKSEYKRIYKKAKYKAKIKIISEHWVHYESDNVDDARSDANLIALEPEFINDYLFDDARSIKWKDKPIKQQIEVLEIADDKD
tara:strand:+ start:220 stop:474 length:255 start_codon:yes stop_codon:yes gene_type:complete